MKKNKKEESIKVKQSNQNAKSYDYVSEDKNLKVNVNLFPPNELMEDNYGYNLYQELVEHQVQEGMELFIILFGFDEDDRIKRGERKLALLTINDNQMYIPYNTIVGDESNSLLFHHFTGEEFLFTNTQAVITMAALIFTRYNSYKEDFSSLNEYVEYISDSFLPNHFDSYLKRFVIEMNDDKRNSYKLLR